MFIVYIYMDADFNMYCITTYANYKHDYTILQYYWWCRNSNGHIQLHAEVLLRNLQSPSNSGARSQLLGWYTRYP